MIGNAKPRSRLGMLLAGVGLLVPSAIAAVAGGPARADTTTITINASADAFVAKQYPDTNYGTGPALRTGGPQGYETFLGFQVRGTATGVVRATLRIYAETSSAAGYNVARWDDGDWSETGITWNYVQSEPPSALGPVVGTSGKFAAGSWTSVDVTSLVQTDGYLTLVLLPANSTATRYSSRENTTTGPQLVVETSSKSPSPSPSPAPSASPTIDPITANPTADSYVSPMYPNANYGTLTALRTGGSQQYEAFVGFYVAGTGGSVSKATLRVYAETSNSAGYKVATWNDTGWTETGITWNYVQAQPASTLGPVIGSSGGFASEQWTSVDVTSAVRGDGAVTFVMQAANSTATRYSSRENTTTPPQLVIETSGSPSASPSPSPSASPSPSPGGDPVIAAAGDIACDPDSSNFNGGLGQSSACRQKYTADLMLGMSNLQAVLALGDNQYYCGGYSAFTQSYDLSWGKLKSITHPVVGNHEYLTSGGTGCDQSNLGGAGYFKYFGAAAGDPTQGYYAFNIGSWRLYALNSNCSAAGGCSATSPQGQWLAADLAANPRTCVLAYWHIPLWSSGGRAAANTKALTQILYNAGADVVLTGHDHTYERFAPQDPNSNPDPTNGIRAWVVGTGGANHTSLSALAPNSQVFNSNTFGVLKLTLHADSYDWQFIPATFTGNGTFTDSGTASCH